MHARRLPIQVSELNAFYGAALGTLAALEARNHGPRSIKFGKAAREGFAALGGSFAGYERAELLVREAAVVHPLAFAPRAIFQLKGLMDDEPFGPDWMADEPALLTKADRFLAELDAAFEATELGELGAFAPLLHRVCAAWSMPLPPISEETVRRVRQALTGRTQVVVAGTTALATLLLAAENLAGIDLRSQAALVTGESTQSDPLRHLQHTESSLGERHLFGAGLAWLSAAATSARIWGPAEPPTEAHFDLLLVSDDASDSVRERASGLGPSAERIEFSSL